MCLNKDKLLKYYKQGLSDASIGSLYGMTGEGIARRRKKYGILLEDKFNQKKEDIKKFRALSKEELFKDYYGLTQEEFAKKYKISKIVWLPILRQKGIIGKFENRVNSYPKVLTDTQRSMIIGSLLGDGSVSQEKYFYEAHSKQQAQYLYKKYEILLPYSGLIRSVDKGTGLRFKTASHTVFKEFYDKFYIKGLKGKQIPLNYLITNWSDCILGYWYLDDGNFNDEISELTIANKAPVKQLREFLNFLENKYHWGFHCGVVKNINRVSFSKKYYKDFFDIVIQTATPDLYYKIPELFITSEMVDRIPEYSIIKPKFYRKADSMIKPVIFNRCIDQLKADGFPEPGLTLKRYNYLLGIVKKYPEKSISARFRLWEHDNSNIYDEARRLWNSEEFLNKIVKKLLLEYRVITGRTIREVIRIILEIVL